MRIRDAEHAWDQGEDMERAQYKTVCPHWGAVAEFHNHLSYI